MLENLGKRRFALPFAMALVVGLLFTFMLYPMAKMEVKDLPFGVVNLDEGAATPMGDVNAGELAIEVIASGQGALQGEGESQASPVAWSVCESMEELDEALADGAFYGAIVIPADFTARQMAFAAGASEEGPAVEVLLDVAKSPMVANLMRTNIAVMLSEAGVNAEVTLLNEGPSSEGANALSTLMSQNFLIMPLVMLSVMLALMTAVLFAPKSGDGRKERIMGAGGQAAFAAGVSCVVALAVLFLAWFALGFEDGLGAIFGFAWISSFCMMACVLGFANVALPLGALAAVCALLGMCCGMLAPEMLPEFWQSWVYPWAPQHFIGDGMRAIVYMGEGALNESCVPLAFMAAIGLALLVISSLLPRGASGKAAQSGRG